MWLHALRNTFCSSSLHLQMKLGLCHAKTKTDINSIHKHSGFLLLSSSETDSGLNLHFVECPSCFGIRVLSYINCPMTYQSTTLHCCVLCVCLQVLQVSPNWESQAPKEKMVRQVPRAFLDLLDSRARLDHRVCVTAVKAARELPSKQVCY